MDFFVKESYGYIWHFYHNSHGICYCKMKDENITQYSVLVPDGREDFDVLIDDSDCIHLVYQNQNGDIVYANHFNGQWRRGTIMQSKTATSYNKNFVIKRVNNWLNIFYCIEYNGNTMLTHQIIDRDDVSPLVIDCIKGKYSVAQDSSGNIYLLIYSETNKSWGIRKYVWSKKEWEDFEGIAVLDGCKSAFLFIDNDDKKHILYDIDSCIRSYCDGENIILGTGQNPSMFYKGENTAIWEGVADNKVYVRRDSDSAPTVFMSGGFAKPSVFKLRYTSYEPEIIADRCFGSITNGAVKTYGVINFFAVAKKPEPRSTVSTVPERSNDNYYLELQKLKIQLSQLENTVDRLKDKLN